MKLCSLSLSLSHLLHIPPLVSYVRRAELPLRPAHMAKMSFLVTPGMRLASPGRPSAQFVCRQCQSLRQRPRAASSRILQSLKQFRRHATTATTVATATTLPLTKRPVLSPAFFNTSSTAAITTATHSAGQATNRAFPEATSSRSVAYWLLGSAASVFGIVVFGGLTRLTESGYASPLPV